MVFDINTTVAYAVHPDADSIMALRIFCYLLGNYILKIGHMDG